MSVSIPKGGPRRTLAMMGDRSRWLPMPRSPFYRPVLFTTSVVLGLALVTLVSLVVLGLRSRGQLAEVRSYLSTHRQIHQTISQLQRTLIEAQAEAPIEAELVNRVREGVAKVLSADAPLDGRSGENLLELGRLLGESNTASRDRLLGILPLLEDITDRVGQEQQGLLELVARRNRRQTVIIGAALASLVGLTILYGVLLRRRILRPLDSLRDLLTRLSEGDFTAIDASRADAALVPLLDNYNRLVGRLQELEAVHRAQTETLERRVERASKTLLEQQHELARRERLAAVGEVSAVLSHELRNPLAGIRATLGNLQQELPGAETQERLDLCVRELDRMSRLLDESLDRIRHTPEAPVELEIGQAVEDLLALVRAQVPAEIAFEVSCPKGLRCRLPEGRFRQALLNLLLNSCEALGGRRGRVTIGASIRDERLRIEVSDNGPGFPASLLEHGIQLFVSTRAAGSGLGLAMVRRFASDLGGQLELENRLPVGSVATLSFPRRMVGA